MGRLLEAIFLFGVVVMVTTASGQDSPGIHRGNEQSPTADPYYKVENMGLASEQLDAGSGRDIRNVPHGAAPAREKTKRMPFRYNPMVTKLLPVTTRRRMDEDENSEDAGRKLVESLKTAKQDRGVFPTQLGHFLCCVRKICPCNST